MLARARDFLTRKGTAEPRLEAELLVAQLAEGFDFVVMGHNHQSHYERYEKGTYVNLGDWIDECTYAVFDGRRITLRRFRG